MADLYECVQEGHEVLVIKLQINEVVRIRTKH